MKTLDQKMKSIGRVRRKKVEACVASLIYHQRKLRKDVATGQWRFDGDPLVIENVRPMAEVLRADTSKLT